MLVASHTDQRKDLNTGTKKASLLFDIMSSSTSSDIPASPDELSSERQMNDTSIPTQSSDSLVPSSEEVEEERHMNDTTMPPPKPRSLHGKNTSMPPPPPSLPSGSMSSSTTPTPSPNMVVGATASSRVQQQQQPSRRQKTGLRKGFGLSDWNRLLSVSKDLAQRRGQAIRRIRWDEIKKHNSPHDGWIVLKKKVYFISPYIAYHPGGERILKPVLGKDATALFNKYHRWVNEEP